MTEPNPPEPAFSLDLNFLARVYRTSLVLMALLGSWIWGSAGQPSALAWLLGCALSLMGLYATEWSIRRFITPESRSAGGLLWVSMLKLFLIMGIVFSAFWAATRGWINLPWALPGFMLPHIVLVLKLAGRKLLQVVGSTRKT